MPIQTNQHTFLRKGIPWDEWGYYKDVRHSSSLKQHNIAVLNEQEKPKNKYKLLLVDTVSFIKQHFDFDILQMM